MNTPPPLPPESDPGHPRHAARNLPLPEWLTPGRAYGSIAVGGAFGALAATLFLTAVVLTFYHDHLPHWLGMLVLKVWGMSALITLILAGLYRKGWRAFEHAFAGVMVALLLWSMTMALLFPPMMQMRGEAPRHLLITGSAFLDFFRNAGAETMLYSFAYVPLLALVWTGISMVGRFWVWRGRRA